MLKKLHKNVTFKIRFFGVHLVFWILFLILPISDFIHIHNTIPVSFFVRILFCIGIFYFNYFILVPQLLLKKKPLHYAVSVIVLIGGLAFIFSQFDKPPVFANDRFMHHRPEFKDGLHLFPNIIMFALHILLSSVIKMYIEWTMSFKKQKETETDKKTHELNFLKTQLNPHFFFNALNTIYSLSIKKSDTTPTAVLNLADLMRYMLYETNKELVRLSDELSYIESYIEMQRLRLTENNTVQYKAEGNATGITIPPLLLIGFIENAFKYGVNPSHVSEINIHITLEKGQLRLLTVNDVNNPVKKDERHTHSIENITKRLELYFPKRYTLETHTRNRKHYSDLTILLHES